MTSSGLDPDGLSAGLAPPWRRIEHHFTIGSTNVRAAEIAEPWSVVVADHQSAGRGRLARTWEAPPGSSIAVSATLPRPDHAASWLPLAAGLAVAEAVSATTGLEADLKWPNDVLLPADGDRKVSGILVEVRDDLGIVGAGVNVSQGRDELPVPTATSLALAGRPEVDVTALALTYLRALATRYVSLAGPSLPSLRDAYRKRCSTLGRQVTLVREGAPDVVGTASAVDDEGRLVLTDRQGRTSTWAAGDVVHARTG